MLGCLLLLGACSSTTFLYNRLDFLLPWYVDDYADLNGQQEIYLAQLLTPFLAWHRKQELASYIQILQSIQTSLDQPQTAAGVAAIFADMESAWFRLEDKSLDWLLDFGAQLSDEQMAGFIKVLWEKQDEFKKKYLDRTDEEYYKDSYDELVKSAKDNLGPLSDEQRELLRESSRQLLRSDRAWIQERADWITKLAVLLERKPQWQQRVREAVTERRENLAPEYQRIYDNNLGVICELVAQLLNGRSKPQDQHLRDKLMTLREDMQALIVQGENAAAGERE